MMTDVRLFLLLLFLISCGEKKENNKAPEKTEFIAKLYDCSGQFKMPPEKFQKPCFLDKSCKRLQVVGHRGVGGDFSVMAPENSLSAIRAALIMGLDGIELDIRHTKDEHLVLMHDSDLKKTTGIEKLASQLDLAEVKKIKLLRPVTLKDGDFSCDLVPSLEEAIRLTKNRLFITLDTKTDRVDLVAKFIKKHDFYDQIIVSVSNVDKAIKIRQIDGKIRIQVRPDTIDQVKSFKEKFQRIPDVFEVPLSIASKAAKFLGSSSVVFSDVFELDAAKLISLRTKKQVNIYKPKLNIAGLEMVQLEFPHLLLEEFGLWPFKNSAKAFH